MQAADNEAKKDEGKIKVQETLGAAEQLFPCIFCDKIFRKKGDVIVHLRSHQKPMTYCCVLCEVSFTSIEHFRGHTWQHVADTKTVTRKELSGLSGDIVDSVEEVDINGCGFEVHIKGNGEDFFCKLCDEGVHDWVLAKKHAVKHK